MVIDVLREIEALFAELPAVECLGCGGCCVGPSCTLAEFIYLVRSARESLSPDTFCRCILAPAEIHPEYEGNVRCVFLEGARCMVHPGRTGACRLFGLPALRELDIDDMVYCKHGIDLPQSKPGTDNPECTFPDDERSISNVQRPMSNAQAANSNSQAANPNTQSANPQSPLRNPQFFPAGSIRAWLDKLVELDSSLYSYNTEPFFVTGFNIHCWLDIYFDESFEVEVFGDIRRVMREYLELGEFAAGYTQQSGLKEKVDKITILSAMAGQAQPDTVRQLLVSIRDDYPKTGTYFHAEAQHLLDVLGGVQRE